MAALHRQGSVHLHSHPGCHADHVRADGSGSGTPPPRAADRAQPHWGRSSAVGSDRRGPPGPIADPDTDTDADADGDAGSESDSDAHCDRNAQRDARSQPDEHGEQQRRSTVATTASVNRRGARDPGRAVTAAPLPGRAHAGPIHAERCVRDVAHHPRATRRTDCDPLRRPGLSRASVGPGCSSDARPQIRTSAAGRCTPHRPDHPPRLDRQVHVAAHQARPSARAQRSLPLPWQHPSAPMPGLRPALMA
jgi:hypothetical protein